MKHRIEDGSAILIGWALLGLAGWIYLAVSALGTSPGEAVPAAWPAVIFLVVTVASRVLAARLLPDSFIALDSGFYIAAAVCLGPMPAGWLVAVTLTVDSLLRVRHARRRHGHVAILADTSTVLYFGGMSGALLAVVAQAFQVEGLAVGAVASDWVTVAMVLGTGLVFLLAHYSIQGIRLFSLGGTVRTYLGRLALPALIAETALLPLAAVVVFLYDPVNPAKLGLLGLTYLVIAYAFHRLSSTREALQLRVAELETVNVTAHRLASTLDSRELVENVAREALFAIPEAELLTVTLAIEGSSRLSVEVFERHQPPRRMSSLAGGYLADEVMAAGRSIHERNVATNDMATASRGGADIRSWIGVPIQIYGVVEGVLSVQSRVPGAFSPERVRLLEAIGAQTAVALKNARLYELAMVDGLTGLFVRRYFDARLDEEVERSRRFDTEFSLVMMDIDDFKKLNDTHGHTAGDRLLRAVAEIVKREMRAVDTAARYGGEEFSLILPRTSMLDAYSVAERIRQQIADQPLVVDGRPLAVTASFGIASFPGSKADDAESLIRLADRALYRSKKAGKNRVELYWADGDDARSSIRTV